MMHGQTKIKCTEETVSRTYGEKVHVLKKKVNYSHCLEVFHYFKWC